MALLVMLSKQDTFRRRSILFFFKIEEIFVPLDEIRQIEQNHPCMDRRQIEQNHPCMDRRQIEQNHPCMDRIQLQPHTSTKTF